jgi:hypothetical protein
MLSNEGGKGHAGPYAALESHGVKMSESGAERWFAAHYDVHGNLILSAPLSSSTAVGKVIDSDPAKYRERLAVIERGAVRTLAFGRPLSTGNSYEFKRGPRLP